MSQSGNSLNSSNFFIIIIFAMVNCDQWSLVLVLKKKTRLAEDSDDGF